MAETREIKPSERPGSGCLDKFLLLGAALLVCILGVAAFWIADVYHVNPMWVFFLWNSMFLVPIFIKDFRGHLRKPAFLAFLLIWGLAHGLVVVALMRWTPISAWILGISLELVVGYVVADRVFDIRRATKETVE